MSNKISKSLKSQRQEKELKELELQLKKRRSTLKGLRTRLRRMKDQILDIQTRSSSILFAKMEQIDQLRMELVNLARKLQKLATLNEIEKRELQTLCDELSSDSFMGPDYEFHKGQATDDEHDFESHEREKAEYSDQFLAFKVAPDPGEKKQIRKIFLRLSNKLHPDKAKNDREAKRFHELMQRINEAYENHDVETLLNLESRYLHEDWDINQEIEALTDVLSRRIEKVSKELALIKSQIGRTSTEIKNLRNSTVGKMLTEMQQADRNGNGLDADINHVEEVLENLRNLKEGLEHSIEIGAISPRMNRFKARYEKGDLDEEMLERLDKKLREEFGDHYDPMEVVSDFMDNFRHSNIDKENLDFPPGTFVKIKTTRKHDFIPNLKMTEWSGRINDVYNSPDGGLDYEVLLDSASLTKIPGSKLKKAIQKNLPFDIHLFKNTELERAESAETEGQRLATFRKILHQYLWPMKTDDPEQIARLQAIMWQKPGKPDWDNWTIYLEKRLSFPFKAFFRFADQGQKRITILRLLKYDAENGHILKVGYGKLEIKVPFHSIILPPKERELREILDDYQLWSRIFLAVPD